MSAFAATFTLLHEVFRRLSINVHCVNERPGKESDFQWTKIPLSIRVVKFGPGGNFFSLCYNWGLCGFTHLKLSPINQKFAILSIWSFLSVYISPSSPLPTYFFCVCFRSLSSYLFWPFMRVAAMTVLFIEKVVKRQYTNGKRKVINKLAQERRFYLKSVTNFKLMRWCAPRRTLVPILCINFPISICSTLKKEASSCVIRE